MAPKVLNPFEPPPPPRKRPVPVPVRPIKVLGGPGSKVRGSGPLLPPKRVPLPVAAPAAPEPPPVVLRTERGPQLDKLKEVRESTPFTDEVVKANQVEKAKREALSKMPDFARLENVRRPSNFVSFAEFAGANDEGFRQRAANSFGDQRAAIIDSKRALARASKGNVSVDTPYATTGTYADFQKAHAAAGETVAGTPGALEVSSNPMEEALMQVYRSRVSEGAEKAGAELEGIGAQGAKMAETKDDGARQTAQSAARDAQRKEASRLAQEEAKARAEYEAEHSAEKQAVRGQWKQSIEFSQALQDFAAQNGRPMTEEEMSEWIEYRSQGGTAGPTFNGDDGGYSP